MTDISVITEQNLTVNPVNTCV